MIHNEAQIEIVQNNVYQNVYPQITERGNHHTEGVRYLFQAKI